MGLNSIMLASLFRSSTIAAMGTFVVFMVVTIVGQLLFPISYGILFYTSGDGATANIGGYDANSGIRTGTNALSSLLVQWLRNPDIIVNFCTFNPQETIQGSLRNHIILATDSISTVVAALTVSASYVFAFFLVSWLTFKRSQIAN